jgi:hypothetical protein
LFFSKNRTRDIESVKVFKLWKLVHYFEDFAPVFDKLIQDGILPEDDKMLRKEFIKAYKRDQIVDLLFPEKSQDNRS